MIRRFIRRLRFFGRSPYIVKVEKTRWTVDDSKGLEQFLGSTTGKRLLTAMDDVVFNAVMKGSSREYVDGLTDVRAYLLELGSVQKPREPLLEEDEENWRTE